MATANKLGCYIACTHVLAGALHAVTESPTLAEPGLVACSECAERGKQPGFRLRVWKENSLDGFKAVTAGDLRR